MACSTSAALVLVRSSFADLFLKVLIKNRDRLDLYVNPFRFKILVGDAAQLGRDAFHAQALVAEVLPGQHIDLCKGLVVGHIVQGLPGGKDQVQASWSAS